MNIAICDDDPKTRSIIQKYILSYFHDANLEKPHLFLFSSAEAMLQKKMRFDIAYLDVEMPGISGIASISTLREWNKDIILIVITGFSDTYLDESFETGAYRYMIKPLNEMRFRNNLKAALRKYTNSTTILPIDTTIGLIPLPVDSIILVQTENRKTVVYTDKKTYETGYRIGYWLEILPDDHFAETYKGIIVNFKYVSAFYEEEIELAGINKHVYMARRRSAAIKKKYLLYLEANT